MIVECARIDTSELGSICA